MFRNQYDSDATVWSPQVVFFEIAREVEVVVLIITVTCNNILYWWNLYPEFVGVGIFDRYRSLLLDVPVR